jgi:hypothetical protein
MKQNNCGNDVLAAPDNVPMPTQGLIRPTVNSTSGNSVLAQAKGTPEVSAAKPAKANPFAGSWSGDGSLHGW